MTKRKPTIFDLMIITGIMLVLLAIPMGILFVFESGQTFRGDWHWRMIAGVIMTMAMIVIGLLLFWTGGTILNRRLRATIRASTQNLDIQALKAITWLEPWEAFPDAPLRTEKGITGYDLQLIREVGPKHPLFSYKSRAIPIGARCDCDDRLYWIPDQQHPFVVVHITWVGMAQQGSPEHPTTEFYRSFEDWQERCMKTDHEFTRSSGKQKKL